MSLNFSMLRVVLGSLVFMSAFSAHALVEGFLKTWRTPKLQSIKLVMQAMVVVALLYVIAPYPLSAGTLMDWIAALIAAATPSIILRDICRSRDETSLHVQ